MKTGGSEYEDEAMNARNYRHVLYDSYVESQVKQTGEISSKTLRGQSGIYRKLLKRFMPAQKEAAILDAGCGAGGLVYFLQHEGYRNARGVDISPSQTALGKELGINNIEQADLFVFLKGHAAAFDLIIAFDLMEHLKKEEVLLFLTETFSALKPGGVLLIRTLNAASPLSGNYRYGDFTHELSFTASSVTQILTATGFKGIRLYPVEPAIHGVVSALRYVLWRGMDLFFRLYLASETGFIRNQILTQNLIAMARVPD